MHNEEFWNVTLQRIILAMKWAGHVARTEEIRNAYNILVRKPDRVKRPRHRWEDNITKVLEFG
jgi:hypothetical protein